MNSETAYHQWREQYKTTLDTFYAKNVLMLFSGGKDSSLAMDFILRAKHEFGFSFEAHAAAFPVHRYPDTEKTRIESYWNSRGTVVQWHDLGENDDYISNEVNPCLKCQKLRKQMLNNILENMVDDWKSVVLVTGYSLWDIVSYSIEHVLHDLFSNYADPANTQRYMETAQRFYPLLKMKEGYTVFRPLITYNSNGIQNMVTRAGIPTISIPCKFNECRPKVILETYYQKMGVYFDYNSVLNFAKNSLDLPVPAAFTSIDRDEYLLKIF